MTVRATILITTKDRKQELKRALSSALEQSERSEILVFDDGSSDGTSEMVRNCFPSVVCYRSERALGIIGARNQAMRLATGSLVITIDDDCVFRSRNTVAQTLADFNDPQVAAVAIPSIDVNKPTLVDSKSPSGNEPFAISEFIGCASAVRRDVFLDLGGFRPALWRQAEEYDFCTRLLQAGYLTRCGSADPILHCCSENSRDSAKIIFHSARGNVLYVWLNVPLPQALWHFAGTVFHCIRHGIADGNTWAAIRGTCSGVGYVVRHPRERNPIHHCVYHLIRTLRKRGPMPLDAVRCGLPSIAKRP